MVGWVGGSNGNKANLSPARAGVGLSLAKSETLKSVTKNKEIADVHISGTTSCGSQVVIKVRLPYC